MQEQQRDTKEAQAQGITGLGVVLDTDQREKDQIIERQLRFQNLLMSISTQYINADVSDIDGLIQKSLQQIGEFVEADRSYIFSYDFTNNTTSNT